MFATNYSEGGRSLDVLAARVRELYPAVYRRFHASRQHIVGADVTPRMLGVLQHLASAGPLTVGEQALHLGLSRAAMTELVDRLEAKDLAARTRDQRDRRRVFVWLTDEGRKRVAAHPEVLGGTELREAIAMMRPPDRKALVEGLEALLQAGERVSAIHKEETA